MSTETQVHSEAPNDEIARLRVERDLLARDLETLRATNQRLHRRAQAAEAALGRTSSGAMFLAHREAIDDAEAKLARLDKAAAEVIAAREALTLAVNRLVEARPRPTARLDLIR